MLKSVVTILMCSYGAAQKIQPVAVARTCCITALGCSFVSRLAQRAAACCSAYVCFSHHGVPGTEVTAALSLGHIAW